MLQTRSEVFKMRNYLRNKMKDRLQYCLNWKKNVDIYFTSSNISKMTFFKGDGDQDQPRIIVSE